MRLALPGSKRSLCGRTENSNNGPSVFLHTADTYVVTNDSVKCQGKSPPGGLEAQFPPETLITFTGLHNAPLITCSCSLGADNAGDPAGQLGGLWAEVTAGAAVLLIVD